MKYEYWFAGIKGVSDQKKIRLKEAFSSAESIYYIEETALRQRKILTEKEMECVMQAKRQQDLEEQLNAFKEQNIQAVFF